MAGRRDEVRPKAAGTGAFFAAFFCALGVGLVFGFLAGLVAGFFLREEYLGLGTLVGRVAGLIAGHPLGAVIGLIAARRIWRLRGSLVLGVVGSVVGGLVTILPAEPFNLNAAVTIVAYVIAVPLLGVVGFVAGGRVRSGK